MLGPGPEVVRIRREIVDAHIHHWDPSNLAWYPFLDRAKPDSFPEFGDFSKMVRKFDPATLLAESEPFLLRGYVHVAAAARMHSMAETEYLASFLSNAECPTVLIGTLDISQAWSDIVQQLDAQVKHPEFVGLRLHQRFDYGSTFGKRLMKMLSERNLVYDLCVTPPEMVTFARELKKFPDLQIVIEHTGRPLVADDAMHFRDWSQGMRALADGGENVSCKISGLAMTLHSFDPAGFRPWFERTFELFGAERTLLASNFPVDGIWGSFSELYRTYESLSAGLSLAEQDAIFRANATRIYQMTASAPPSASYPVSAANIGEKR